MVALRVPAADGENPIAKVELAPAGTGEVGAVMTGKALACGPVMATFGVPLRLSGAVPTFAMVNVRSTRAPPTAVWPKSALPVMATLPTGVDAPPRIKVP